jgi:hypothetical protein
VNRRFVRKCVLWLLPLLAVRAFLPVGFMLSTDASGPALAFCPTQSPALAAAFPLNTDAPQRDGHHQHHQAPVDADGPVASADPPCPYALGAVAIQTSAHCVARLLQPFEQESAFPTSRLVPVFGPARLESVRGPPALS